MSMLRSLEVLSYGNDRSHYPVSPKLLDPTKLETWRRNIVQTGTKDDLQRYEKAMYSAPVRAALDLDALDGNHGS